MIAEGRVHRCRKCSGYYRAYSFSPEVAKDCSKHDANNYVLKGEYELHETHNKEKYGKM